MSFVSIQHMQSARNAVVTCDGENITARCFAADETSGTAWCYKVDGVGKFVLYNEGMEPDIEILRGTVKIIMAECPPSPTATHCWHITEMLLTQPPQNRLRCCWCGAREMMERRREMHGSFARGYQHVVHLPLVPTPHVCGTCGGELDAVRPGKYQCPKCE